MTEGLSGVEVEGEDELFPHLSSLDEKGLFPSDSAISGSERRSGAVQDFTESQVLPRGHRHAQARVR